MLEEARAMARGTQELRSIQILRAVAVLQVVFLHFAVASSSQAYLPVPFFTDFGWLGVRLFFVISGFIIAVTIEKEPSITRYLLKRYFRIFPLYMVATLVTLLGLLVAQDGLQVTTRNDFGNVIHLQGPDVLWWGLKSLLIIPQDPWPVFSVGWSLEHEVMFYLAFGLAYFGLGIRAATWLLLFLTGLGFLVDAVPFDHAQLSFPYFLAGLIIARIYRLPARRLRWAGLVALLGLGAANVHCLYGLSMTRGAVFVMLNAAFLGVLVYLAVVFEHRIPRWRLTRALVRIGDASYSVYLFHMLLLPIVLLVPVAWFTFVPEPLGGAVHPLLELHRLCCLAFLLLACQLIHKVVEKPLGARIKAILEGAPRVGRKPRPVPG